MLSTPGSSLSAALRSLRSWAVATVSNTDRSCSRHSRHRPALWRTLYPHRNRSPHLCLPFSRMAIRTTKTTIFPSDSRACPASASARTCKGFPKRHPHRDSMPFSNPFVLVVRWLPFARNLGCLDCLFRFRLSSPTFVCCSYTPLFQPPLSWAHRSGNSCPLRPTRLLLSRLRPQHHQVPRECSR